MDFENIIKSDSKRAQLVRFVMVGGFCTILQYGVYVIFVNAVRVPAVVSTIISYAISFVVNFFLSSLFTFHSKANAKKGLAFTLSHLINMGLQTGFVAIFKGIVGPTLALLPALAICIPANYFMVRFSFTSKLFSNKKKESKSISQEDFNEYVYPVNSLIKSENMEKVAFCSDHAGYELKKHIMQYMKAKGYEPIDFGTFSEESCDYADYAHPAAIAVEKGECAFGIAMCGSGNGISMTLNKHQGIRDGLCWIPEIAELARRHNAANFITLPARFVSQKLAEEIVEAYLNAEFEGGRHLLRIEKIPVEVM